MYSLIIKFFIEEGDCFVLIGLGLIINVGLFFFIKVFL